MASRASTAVGIDGDHLVDTVDRPSRPPWLALWMPAFFHSPAAPRWTSPCSSRVWLRLEESAAPCFSPVRRRRDSFASVRSWRRRRISRRECHKPKSIRSDGCWRRKRRSWVESTLPGFAPQLVGWGRADGGGRRWTDRGRAGVQDAGMENLQKTPYFGS